MSRIRLARSTVIRTAVVCVFLIAVATVFVAFDRPACPLDATAIEPGASIQAAVDIVGDGGVFCIKNGVHRAQAVRPKRGQYFYGEGAAVLNGSKLLGGFKREDRYWVATSQLQQLGKHGECLPSAPACDQPDAVFVDDKPLTKVASKDALGPGKFFVDYGGSRIYLADDPANHKVEATAAAFAFESAAPDVTIKNITIEKYGSPAQRGAIHARDGARWTIEDCVVRLNSGAGISVGDGTRVHNCDVDNNGQIGIEGNGKNIRIEGNRIWGNNIYGFDPAWEAGGAKIADSDGVEFRDNHVYDNNGSGLWCDIDCRNVVYEGNVVENNRHIGIFHEISFKAVIRKNIVRHNGIDNKKFFWGSDIVVAASQDVEVTDNKVTVSPGACGIVLIDQGRRNDAGKEYKTRNNIVHGNEMTFEGAVCAGGASDTQPDDANYDIIAKGNNRFDGNTYRVRGVGEPPQFVWGRDITDWAGFRRNGLEQAGRLVLSDK